MDKDGMFLNIGHGHVYPRPDGVLARCGGPGLCAECSKDLALQQDAERREALRQKIISELHSQYSPQEKP